MGVLLRRFSESLRQRTLKSKAFTATSTARCGEMLREAGEFAASIRLMEKELRAMQGSTKSLLTTTRLVLSKPLPNLYPDDQAVSAAKTPLSEKMHSESIGGPGFNSEGLFKLASDIGRDMELDVFEPLDRWGKAYESMVARSKGVELLRLDLDSRRRSVAELGARVEALKAKLSRVEAVQVKLPAVEENPEEIVTTKDQAKIDALKKKLQDLEKKLEHKEAKVAAATAAYIEAEAELHKQLVSLVEDAAWTRQYISSAMLILGETLMKSSGTTGSSGAAASISEDELASPSSVSTAQHRASSRPSPPRSPPRPNTPSVGGPLKKPFVPSASTSSLQIPPTVSSS